LKFNVSPPNVASAFTTRPANVVANVSSVVGLIVATAGELSFKSTAIPIAYLCLLSLFLVARYVRQERWARYAEASQTMDRAQRRLKEAGDRVLYGSGDTEYYFSKAQEALSAFAEAFTLVTGSNCSASLKEVYVQALPTVPSHRGDKPKPQDSTFVATIVRSDPDNNRNVSAEAPDLIRDNSDFEYVLRTSQPFFAGDLPKMWLNREYRNSHWPETLRQTKEFPYRSTIVWPIEVEPHFRGQSEDQRERVIAFLCIDSRQRNAFRRRADVPFGGAFAHALYVGLSYALV
jgi:hypothetical protein